MSRAAPAHPQPTGHSATLVVLRLVLALLDHILADFADLPATHPERRLFTRIRADIARAEARILAEIALEEVAPAPHTGGVRARRAGVRTPRLRNRRRIRHVSPGPRARRAARAPPCAAAYLKSRHGTPASAVVTVRPPLALPPDRANHRRPTLHEAAA